MGEYGWTALLRRCRRRRRRSTFTTRGATTKRVERTTGAGLKQTKTCSSAFLGTKTLILEMKDQVLPSCAAVCSDMAMRVWRIKLAKAPPRSHGPGASELQRRLHFPVETKEGSKGDLRDQDLCELVNHPPVPQQRVQREGH